MKGENMEEINILKKLEKVKAPFGFEQRVMSQISLRKRKQEKARQLRFSLAGAFSLLAVFFIVFNVFILPQKDMQEFSGLDEESPSILQRRGIDVSQRGIIPVIEAVDYKGEIQAISQEPSTIFILEQVSDTADTQITY